MSFRHGLPAIQVDFAPLRILSKPENGPGSAMPSPAILRYCLARLEFNFGDRNIWGYSQGSIISAERARINQTPGRHFFIERSKYIKKTKINRHISAALLEQARNRALLQH